MLSPHFFSILSILATATSTFGAPMSSNGIVERATPSTGIIVPIYFDPAEGTCYPELASAYSANPLLPWTLILNPNSGYSSSITPMLACIPSLRANLPTAKLIGYVPTGYGNSSRSRFVASQINSWAGMTSKGLAVDGIFFDETSTSGNNASTYTTYSTNVKKAFGETAFIVMNAGIPVLNSAFWKIANLIVTYEGTYAGFSATPLSTRLQVPAQSVVIIHTIPTRGEATTSQSLVDTLVPKFGALYFTDLNYNTDQNVYKSLGAGFGTFVNQVGAKQGVVCGRC